MRGAPLIPVSNYFITRKRNISGRNTIEENVFELGKEACQVLVGDVLAV